jgi:sugar O-acyltransferase (sialic acid O-acetyltransferase NeuD family)
MDGVELWIAGAGGVGREALDVALAVDQGVSGFLDDAPASGLVRGLPVKLIDGFPRGERFLVAIGAPAPRLTVATRLVEAGGLPLALVHPTAVVGPETMVADGALVMALAHVSSSVRVGAHAQVHYGATIGHDTVLGAGATVLPGANVAGAVVLEDGVTIGTGAQVLQGLTIGAGTIIGAGAVVTRSVPAGSTMVGAPARPLSRGH